MRKPVLTKYEVALEMLNAKKFDPGATEYENVSVLFSLRNELVHFKPVWGPLQKHAVSATAALNAKFPTSPFVGSGDDFAASRCMSYGCTAWTVASAQAFIKEFSKLSAASFEKL